MARPMIRLATVRATGKRYRVLQIDTSGAANVVVCYGEITSHKGLAARFEGVVKFPGVEVAIADVELTPALLRSLVEQRIDGLREAGHTVTVSRTGRRYTDHGTPAQRAEHAAIARELRELFALPGGR